MHRFAHRADNTEQAFVAGFLPRAQEFIHDREY